MNRGRLFVISGPSGVGKGTVAKMVLGNKTLKLKEIPTCTTRPKRPGEKSGQERYFLTTSKFQKLDGSGGLVEKNFYNGHWYGTPKKNLDEALEKGETVLLEIDVRGAKNLKKQFPQAILIFISSTLGDIENRLITRRQNTQEEIKERLAIAKKELSCQNDYDYIIENPQGHPEIAADKISKIISEAQ